MEIKLKKYFWDYNFEEEELQYLLQGKIRNLGHLDLQGLFARIMASENWYNVIKIIGKQNIEFALSDLVIDKIFSKSLKQKYKVAGRILSR